ncbi:MAG: pyrF, partial [Paucimonas sp.]|nr:pyrF [Paucimonas sp.]
MLCVGLDPDLARIPAELRNAPDGVARFCIGMIDATAD